VLSSPTHMHTPFPPLLHSVLSEETRTDVCECRTENTKYFLSDRIVPVGVRFLTLFSSPNFLLDQFDIPPAFDRLSNLNAASLDSSWSIKWWEMEDRVSIKGEKAFFQSPIKREPWIINFYIRKATYTEKRANFLIVIWRDDTFTRRQDRERCQCKRRLKKCRNNRLRTAIKEDAGASSDP